MTNNSSSESPGDTDLFDSIVNISDGAYSAGLMPWDISDPFFSASTRILLKRVLKCYVMQAVLFVGIPGNFLCCIVFFKQGLSDRINLMLFWLAVTDLGSLFSRLLLMPECYFTDKIQIHNWAVLVNTQISLTSWWLGHLSGALVVIVSVDRCLSVAFPLKAKRWMGYRSTVTAIVLSYSVSFVMFLPAFLAYKRGWKIDPATNRSIAFMKETSILPFESSFAVDMVFFCLAIALPVLLGTMIVCCTITIFNLRQASRQRLKMTGKVTEESKAGQNRITIMLLIICSVYFVLTLPEAVFAIVVMVVPGLHAYQKYHNTVIIIYQMFWVSTCLNSAVNFFVYFMLSSRFQKTLKDLFVECVKGSSASKKGTS